MRRGLGLIALVWIAAFVGVAPALAAAPATLDGVLAELAGHAAVRARFVQTRTDPALAKPQQSHGKLLFVAARGMLWQVEAPVAETLAFTPRGAARVGLDGRSRPLRSRRGMDRATQMLQALLAGQADAVARQFDVTVHGSLAAWSLEFRPRDRHVAGVLASITLAGGEFLTGIDIRLASGATTAIRFSDATDAGPLSAFEQRALAPR